MTLPWGEEPHPSLPQQTGEGVRLAVLLADVAVMQGSLKGEPKWTTRP